jgi:hypothetical protein
MKKLLFITVVFLYAVFFLSSCNKKETETTNKPLHANTPTSAYISRESVGGSFQHFITFLDLSSPTTAEKKYFKVQLKFVGVKDSFETVVPPQSINQMATGFPVDITVAPGHGLLNQWTNPLYTLKTNGGSQYIQDTIVRNPQSNIYHLYLNYKSGPLQGKFSQSSFDGYEVPTGLNGANNAHYRTIFYFTEGLCLDANNYEATTNIKQIATWYRGAPNVYDWKNVGAGLQISWGTRSTFYFLDFKNWRYFRWEQFRSNILNGQLGTTFEGYQSLDNFIKWPDGWGKK